MKLGTLNTVLAIFAIGLPSCDSASGNPSYCGVCIGPASPQPTEDVFCVFQDGNCCISTNGRDVHCYADTSEADCCPPREPTSEPVNEQSLTECRNLPPELDSQVVLDSGRRWCQILGAMTPCLAATFDCTE